MTREIDRSIGKRAGRDLPGDRQKGDQRITAGDRAGNVMDGDFPPTGHGGFCGANRRQGPGTCRKPAGWGTDHVGQGRCRLHGGNTRNQRLAAVTAALEDEARAEVARLGVKPVGDPLAQLAQLAGEVIAWKEATANMVNRLSDLRYGIGAGEQLRGEVLLWERALDRCERVLAVMAKLNIDDRLRRITGAQLDRIEQAVVGTFNEMGLTVEAQDAARLILARRLSGG